jgi:hypothetical protein
LTTTRPEVGFSSPAIIRSVVVLPAPFGPRKPWISPAATSSVMPSTAVNVPYCLTRSWIGDHRVGTAAHQQQSRGAACGTSRMATGPRPADEDRRRILGKRHVEHGHLQAADQRQDGRLLVEAAAREPQVRRVRGKLVQRRVDRQPQSRGPDPSSMYTSGHAW